MATKKTTSPTKKTTSRTAKKTTSRTAKKTAKEAPSAEKTTSATKTSAAKKPAGAKKTTTAKKMSPADDSRKGTDAPRSARRPASASSGDGAGSSGDGAASSGKKPSASSVAAGAARQLLQLTGREVEGVTGLEKTDDGWRVQVEVLEVRRIPDTTDVLAIYEIEVDSDGELVGYHRVSRYVRGAAREE
jgi:hypothetical protein